MHPAKSDFNSVDGRGEPVATHASFPPTNHHLEQFLSNTQENARRARRCCNPPWSRPRLYWRMDRTDGHELITGLNLTPSGTLSATHGNILFSGPDAGTVTLGGTPGDIGLMTITDAATRLMDSDFTLRFFTSGSPGLIATAYLLWQGTRTRFLPELSYPGTSPGPFGVNGSFGINGTAVAITFSTLQFAVGSGANICHVDFFAPLGLSSNSHFVCTYEASLTRLTLYHNGAMVAQRSDGFAPGPDSDEFGITNENARGPMGYPVGPISISSLGIWDYAWDADAVACDWTIGAFDPVV